MSGVRDRGRTKKRVSGVRDRGTGNQVGTPKLVGGWISGLVEWEETRGSGNVQRCKGGKVEVSGPVDWWASGMGGANKSGRVD